MSVKNRLPLTLTGVELEPELAVRADCSYLSNQRKEPIQNLSVLQLGNVLSVLPWDTEDMDLGLRIDIPEGHGVIVLRNKFCSKLTSDDLAKNTIQVFLRLHPRSETHREVIEGQLWLQVPR